MPDSPAIPLLYRLDEVGRVLSLSRSAIYRLLARDELAAVKVGDRTLVTAESLRAYIERLPPAVIRVGRRKPAPATTRPAA